MQRLTDSFPCLAGTGAIWIASPCPEVEFATRWELMGRGDANTRAAAAFVVALFCGGDASDRLGLPAFDLYEAARVCDGPTLAAIAAWVADPWFD